MRRARVLAVGAVIACSVPWSTLQSQVVPRTLRIRGQVTDSGGLAIAAAEVSAGPTDGALPPRLTLTDSAGRYDVDVATSGDSIVIVVRKLGFVAQRRRLPAPGQKSPATVRADFRLMESRQFLRTVTTRVSRPRPVHEGERYRRGAGSQQTSLDVGDGLSGDLSGDLSAALGMVPGISLRPGPGGAPSPTAFGIDAGQNGSTLNGAELGDAVLPRDGLQRTVRLSTYDPKHGGFAGLQVSATLPSGTALRVRELHATIDDPLLQSAGAAADVVGGVREQIVSGVVSGPVTRGSRYFSTAFQLGRRSRPTPTLLSASVPALEAAGLDPSSVTQALHVADSLGIPTLDGGAMSTSTTSGSLIARLDLTPASQPLINTEVPSLYVLGMAAASRTSGLGANITAASGGMAEAEQRDAQLQVTYAPYLLDALSETRLTLSAHDEESRNPSPFPVALVSLQSDLPDEGIVTTPVRLGGEGTTGMEHEWWRLQATNTTSWMTRNRAHTFELFADASLYSFDLTRGADRSGTFVFNSLPDLAGGRPASFTRRLTDDRAAGRSIRGTLGLSDVYYLASDQARAAVVPLDVDGLKLQYGVRMDMERFAYSRQANPLVEQLVDHRMDGAPGGLTIQPMAGFTWNRGVYRVQSGVVTFSDTRSTLSGGFRLYHGVISPENVAGVERRTGLHDGTRQLQCVGDAVPVPNWRAYARSVDAVPSLCANSGEPSSPVQAGSPVTFYAPGFSAPQSLRAQLDWRWLVSGQLHGNIGAAYALNTHQPDQFDVNFGAVPRFLLDDEGGRPVFAPPSHIVPRTGVVALSGSRRIEELGRVTELRSDLRSDYRQLSVGLDYRFGASRFLSPATPVQPRVRGLVRASYVYADSRAQQSGFGATTAGDPREVVWGPGGIPRHTIRLQATASVSEWLSVSVAGRIASGIPFTPLAAGDVNGDGVINDRAFIFDPAATADADVAAGVRRLLDQAPSRARSCLRAQLGTVSEPGSCLGGWTAELATMAITVDPYRIGLGRRGSLTLYVDNLLGGLDQLLHGGASPRGWGSSSFPDATLLTVRGFDSTARRFRYAVNPRFGKPVPALGMRSPFRVAIDLRLDIGRDRETQIIENTMIDAAAWGSADDSARLGDWLTKSAERMDVDDLRTVLRLRDSLRLAPWQEDSIRALRSGFRDMRDSIYADLASYLLENDRDLGGGRVRAYWHGAVSASLRGKYRTAALVRELLSSRQVAWLESRGLAPSLFYSPAWLRSTLRGPLLIY